ncbi:MAG: hypothetical protein IKZ44_10090 [Clostridia bacterium]|nr:hypothetical protein [Clostridia bacterium]
MHAFFVRKHANCPYSLPFCGISAAVRRRVRTDAVVSDRDPSEVTIKGLKSD